MISYFRSIVDATLFVNDPILNTTLTRLKWSFQD